MKRDIDDSNTQMSDKFKNLKEDRPSKTLIEREVEALSKVQAAGIKMVTREMEKRVDAFSQTLKYKILETRHDIDLKTDNILKLASKDITTLRDDIIAHFKANKVISRNGVRHLEAVSDENRNLTNYIMKMQKLTLENAFNSKVISLKGECINQVADIESQLKQQIQQNHLLLIDLKKKLDAVKSRKWPPGSYCILANGKCPAGFSMLSGQMRAISMYSANTTYLKTASFGTNKISCHGKCGMYGHWIGDLFMSACCK